MQPTYIVAIVVHGQFVELLAEHNLTFLTSTYVRLKTEAQRVRTC